MAKYLVTGGSGFIGSNLVDELVKQGHKVTVLDNLSTGKKSNLNPEAKFIKADITKLEKIRPLFKGMDGVFHLAALPRVQLSIDQPNATHEANATGTLNVLVAARNAGVGRVVYSSSSSIYGNAEVLPAHENLKPAPLNPYGLQKYIGEEYCRIFSSLYGLETVSLRYFNVYGSRMSDRGAYLAVIKVFLKSKAAGEPLAIFGDGEQSRDFTHVRDVARANILAMTSKKIGKGEAINIGSGQPYSVNQIAALIGGPKKYLSDRPEIRHSFADSKKAKNLLGWAPKENLEKALKELM